MGTTINELQETLRLNWFKVRIFVEFKPGLKLMIDNDIGEVCQLL